MNSTQRRPDVTYYKSRPSTITVNSSENAEKLSAMLTASLSVACNMTEPGETNLFTVSVTNISDNVINGIYITNDFKDSHMSYIRNSGVFFAENREPEVAEVREYDDKITFCLNTVLEPTKSIYLTFMSLTDNELLPISLSKYVTVKANKSDGVIATNCVTIRAEYAMLNIEKSTICNRNSSLPHEYHLKIRNDGNTKATDIVIEDQLHDCERLYKIYYNNKLLTKEIDYTTEENSVKIMIPESIKPLESSQIRILMSV